MRSVIKHIARKFLGPPLRNVGVITRVMTADPVCSLTFDDGPDPVWTPKILEILRDYRAYATFFMVGEGAAAYPNIVEAVARDGHAIANHSWDHPAFPLVPVTERWRQTSKCQRAIAPFGLKLLRLPYGMNNRATNLEAMVRGYKVIGWSHSSEDWSESDSSMILHNLLESTKPGCIILLHDRIFDMGRPNIGPTNRKETVIDRAPMLFALRELLDRVTGQMEFVTVPLLLQHGKPQH